MTVHLSPQDQLAAIDGGLDASKAEHLASCPACTASVAEMRDMLGDLKAQEIPEPSPLFWDHFSARVRRATAAEPAPSGWALGWRVWAMLASSATAFVLVLVVRYGAVSPAEQPGVSSQPSPIGAALVAGSPSRESRDVEPMAAVVRAASALSSEDLNSVVTLTSDATPLVEDLNPAERAAFVRLLNAEMEKPQ